MDVALFSSNLVAMNAQEARPIGSAPGMNAPLAGPGAAGASPDRATVVPMSQAFPTQAPAADPGMAGVIDRVRADFEAFRLRMQRQSDPMVVQQDARTSIQQMSDMMDKAMRTQVDILELGVSLNAGITAAHQGQGGVKTLIEKA